MLDSVPYLVYFAGPFALAWIVGRRMLKARWSPILIGFPAFFAAWVCVQTLSTVGMKLGGLNEQAFLFGLIASSAAGLFEESARVAAFFILRKLKQPLNWRAGVAYAIGHSGMESFIVGGSILLTIIVVKYAPTLLPEDILEQSRAVVDTGFGLNLYGAFERLFIGLLIHSCFTSVVLLAFVKKQRRYVALAMLWHFGHDMVAFNLHRVSEHWLAHAIWIGFIIVVYSWALRRLIKTLIAATPPQAST